MPRNPRLTPRKIRLGCRLATVPFVVLQNVDVVDRSIRFAKQTYMNESTLKGVPGGQLTVMIQDGLLDEGQHWPIVGQIQERTGSLTGSVRDVLIVRRLMQHDAEKYPEGELRFEKSDTFLSIFFGDVLAGRYSYFAERFVGTEDEATGVLVSQAKKYFKFLEFEEVRNLGKIFWTMVLREKMPLVLAYRQAGRMLYQYARSKGWVKLDVRQKAHYETTLDWISTAEFKTLQGSRGYSRSGVGETTERAANGQPVEWPGD
jgi:hypothetical protein